MKGRKLMAFWVTEFVLVGLYVMTLLVSPDQVPSVGVTIIIMLVGNAATFVGGVVASSWQKSKYFRSELDGK